MHETAMNVRLVQYTPLRDAAVALGGKMCYSDADLDGMIQGVFDKDNSAMIRRIINSGHESVLEHVSFTFAISGVSRALLAQITRHRMASFSVRSQRYVNYDKGFNYVIPPAIEKLGEDAIAEYRAQMEQMNKWYREWTEKLGSGEKANEDARFVLPNACETSMLVTMNARELRHFFELRMCRRAQWEIRALATIMWTLCKSECPVLFEDAGPSCIRGKCAEGNKSCEKPLKHQLETYDE